jgi:glucan-binding YG repeat protein
VNSGNFYILNGTGANSTSWAQQANSRWALQINLSDNYTTFGGIGNFPAEVYAGDSFRAPIFYDSANTNYYLDPNAQSVLYDVQVSNVLRVGPNYHIQQNANGDLEFKFI